MKKAVLISIQPKWCEKICNKIGENTDGSPIYEKRVEVRKSRPKLDTPFPVYIYQTKKTWVYNIFSKIADWQGKVIGEFVCDEIIVAELGHYCNIPCKKAQLDILDLMDYADEKTVYGWHISNLVIYDEPKELSEFSSGSSVFTFDDKGKIVYSGMKRPPQSWCYVEELSE